MATFRDLDQKVRRAAEAIIRLKEDNLSLRTRLDAMQGELKALQEEQKKARRALEDHASCVLRERQLREKVEAILSKVERLRA